MSNPYLKRIEKRGKTDHGRSSERKLIKGLGGQLTPASGALVGAKADGRLGEWIIEAKSTVHESMDLQRGWLTKLQVEALNARRTPVLMVSFVRPDGAAKENGQWAMMPLHIFKELVG